MRDWPAAVAPRFARAVFLDRDGTINEDTGYPSDVEDLHLLPGAVEAIRRLSALPIHVIVVSNQAGIALGLYDVSAMSRFNVALRCAIEERGGRIDAFYYCPHLEAKDLPVDSAPCQCAKPAPGMLLEAARDFGLRLGDSFMIGDKQSDVGAGLNAGVRSVLVGTGKAGSDLPASTFVPTAKADDLRGASELIKDWCRGER